MKICVSNGEILDKLSILEIKYNNILDINKLNNIVKELEYIRICSYDLLLDSKVSNLYKELKNINQKLWNIEDQIRTKEKEKIFDQDFVNLARLVYITNDQRALIKKQINIISDSNFIEEKSYEAY